MGIGTPQGGIKAAFQSVEEKKFGVAMAITFYWGIELELSGLAVAVYRQICIGR